MAYMLFSVHNNYDQPDHNLVAWWSGKPSFDQLAKAMGTTFPAPNDDTTLAVVKVWEMKEATVDQVLYWMATMKEGHDLPIRPSMQETQTKRKTKREAG